MWYHDITREISQEITQRSNPPPTTSVAIRVRDLPPHAKMRPLNTEILSNHNGLTAQQQRRPLLAAKVRGVGRR